MSEPTERPDPLMVDFHLLDRQIVDHTGAKIGKVDDVELEHTDDGRLRVVALLVGQRVLGERMGGPVGRWLAGMANRMRPEEEPLPLRIDFQHVTKVGPEITVGVRRELLPTPPLEEWLRRKLINRIPGAGHASK